MIRRATPEDAATIARLGRITFTESFGYLFSAHAHELHAYLETTFGVAKIEQSLRRPQNLYWLAFAERRPVGYAKLKHPSPPRGMPDAAQLQKIYLLHEHVGAGLGTRLLTHVLLEAQQRAPTIWLDVLRENTRAAGFYQRHRFAPIGQDTYPIGSQTFDFILMAKHFA